MADAVPRKVQDDEQDGSWREGWPTEEGAETSAGRAGRQNMRPDDGKTVQVRGEVWDGAFHRADTK